MQRLLLRCLISICNIFYHYNTQIKCSLKFYRILFISEIHIFGVSSQQFKLVKSIECKFYRSLPRNIREPFIFYTTKRRKVLDKQRVPSSLSLLVQRTLHLVNGFKRARPSWEVIFNRPQLISRETAEQKIFAEEAAEGVSLQLSNIYHTSL